MRFVATPMPVHSPAVNDLYPFLEPRVSGMLDRLREASNVIRGQLDRYEHAQALLEDTEKELEKV